MAVDGAKMLIIDSHEPESQCKKFDALGIQYKVETLPVGDYIFDNKVIFERKEIQDFISSFRSGHSIKQLCQMQEMDNAYLLIVGNFKDLYFKGVQITTEQFEGMLASIHARYKTKVVHADNEASGVRLMVKIAEKCQDGKVLDIYSTELMRSSVKTEDLYLKMLCCVPGISIKKGRKILEKYSLLELWRVDENALIEIEGIGKVLAGKIKSVFTQKINPL